MKKGFYIDYEDRDVYGMSFSVVYMPEENDFQISMMLGCIVIAIGYRF